MDYGHPIKFGTFITPSNGQPQAVVALAQLSERLGYDLVTFQDHPYQPAFLDTWTLMTWVAARTETIHIAPNVLNLPLRPAPVTARAAASLDLLSDGRFDLGLGAGGFWDAIEAMGGHRLTPGQAVDALSEGIDIIRGIWNPDDRTPLRGGEFYPVNGAKRGPVPAHDIPIWIGAYKPRMLRLTGRKGDGWLPSYAWMKGADLATGNATIDEAATQAGRTPSEITRLLNIGADLEPEEIVRLALEEGMSTFIIASDSPAVMQRFAEDVAPAIRDAVAAARGASGTVESSRSTQAISLRRSGILYDEVPESLRAVAIEPGDFGYRSVRSTYMRGGAPGLVLQPRTVAEVIDALAFTRRQPDVPLGLRSGGHGISGRSTNNGGIVIDLKKLNAMEVVNEATRRVRIGPGARWMDVAAFLEPHGWALSSGDYGGVGVGGLATAGGIGWLSRHHGLTIDHLVSADVLLANGTVVTASATEHPDLFWAVRGAGANFGIVVSFEFEVDVVGQVGWAQLAFDASDTAEFLERFGAAVEAAPRELTAFVIIGGRRPGQPLIAQVMAVVDSEDPEQIIAALQPLADIAPLVEQTVQLMPYASVMANASNEPHAGQGEPSFRSGLVEHLTPEFAAASAELIASGSAPWYQIRSAGGAVSDVAPDATAYAHRSANFSLTAIGNSTTFDYHWDALRPHFEGLYLSFESDLSDARIDAAFPPATLARLRELKQHLDPDNVFKDNFNIVPVP
jgi:alkanesulfonate monooxygenase SsuD/methylene tetrahydromethanopterin reductase-like flavin-dependent oxidoreductase (luciferase family)